MLAFGAPRRAVRVSALHATRYTTLHAARYATLYAARDTTLLGVRALSQRQHRGCKEDRKAQHASLWVRQVSGSVKSPGPSCYVNARRRQTTDGRNYSNTGDDPDPNIRFQLYRDISGRFGGSM